MKFASSLAFTLCLAFLFPSYAGAQDVDLASAPGEVHIKMNVEYASAEVDGERWDAEFMNNGKTIAIKGLNRSVEHIIVLTASDDDNGDDDDDKNDIRDVGSIADVVLVLLVHLVHW